MMRFPLVLTSAAILFVGFTACKKSDKTNDARTVANMSGTYNLTALSANLGSINFNLYDTLPACQKDNLILLDSTGTAQFVDAGTICTPPGDSAGVWHLSPKADSLYLGNNSTFIKSFDGKNLVVTTNHFNSYSGALFTITLVKH